jgi:hypothetical protein
MSRWTRFMDMSSGGSHKEDQQYIYIQAPQQLAEIIFYNRFGHNPNRVSCACCGPDYSIDDAESLELACAYNRGCDSNSDGYILDTAKTSLSEYVADADVLIIEAFEIKDSEKIGEVPDEGYYWR